MNTNKWNPKKNPIFENNGKWYFYDDAWGTRYGGYDTEKIALMKLEEYCKKCDGRGTD